MKKTVLVLMLAMAGCLQGFAETPAPAGKTAEAESDAGLSGWSFSAYAFSYFVENARDYIQPTIIADRGALHLEGRYNYENYETTSLWVGYNYEVKTGDTNLSLTVTPMVGFAFGETDGIAPGFKLLATYKNWTLSSEGEYFFDSHESGDDFFYNWSELSYKLDCGMKFGLVMQKETDDDVKRGPLVGYTRSLDRHTLDLTAYLFDLDKGDPMFVIGLGWSFE